MLEHFGVDIGELQIIGPASDNQIYCASGYRCWGSLVGLHLSTDNQIMAADECGAPLEPWPFPRRRAAKWHCRATWPRRSNSFGALSSLSQLQAQTNKSLRMHKLHMICTLIFHDLSVCVVYMPTSSGKSVRTDIHFTLTYQGLRKKRRETVWGDKRARKDSSCSHTIVITQPSR